MCEFIEDMYFYSNACHVCRAYGSGVELKRCSGCKMIAYCSREHQTKHWRRHKDLCRTIASIVKHCGNAFGSKSKRDPSIDAWTRTKTNLMLLIQIKLGRRLLPYETEMFKFPRSCTVCRETDSRLLDDCDNCPGTSFCTDHRSAEGHRTKCAKLRLCFDIETATYAPPPRDVVDVVCLSRKRTLKTMREVVEHCASDQGEDCSKLHRVRVSEYLTRPLTLLFALEMMNRQETSRMTIHIVGANAIEIESIAYWETLLHRFEALTSLRIHLVGPELSRDFHKVALCDECLSKGSTIRVECFDALYADYATSDDFVEADCLVGYNLGIHERVDESSVEDTWTESLRAMTKRECPFVMTSYTFQESLEERRRLCAAIDNRIDYLYSGVNPFASLRPYRDFESEDFFYQNHYVTIYEKLI